MPPVFEQISETIIPRWNPISCTPKPTVTTEERIMFSSWCLPARDEIREREMHVVNWLQFSVPASSKEKGEYMKSIIHSSTGWMGGRNGIATHPGR
jgi:hypothetical protein